MGAINKAVGEQNFEKIAPRIAEILANEIPDQINNFSHPARDPNILIEETRAIDKSKIPAVNVRMERDEFENESRLGSQGRLIHWIDVYESAPQKSDQDASSLSNKRVKNLIGLIRGILMHSKYEALGYQQGISNRRIQRIEVANATEQESYTISFGRIYFECMAAEDEPFVDADLIEEARTEVRLYDTDIGFRFEKV